MAPTRWKRVVAAVRGWWLSLERDWQSVAIGLAVAAVIATFDVRIPW